MVSDLSWFQGDCKQDIMIEGIMMFEYDEVNYEIWSMSFRFNKCFLSHRMLSNEQSI